MLYQDTRHIIQLERSYFTITSKEWALVLKELSGALAKYLKLKCVDDPTVLILKSQSQLRCSVYISFQKINSTTAEDDSLSQNLPAMVELQNWCDKLWLSYQEHCYCANGPATTHRPKKIPMASEAYEELADIYWYIAKKSDQDPSRKSKAMDSHVACLHALEKGAQTLGARKEVQLRIAMAYNNIEKLHKQHFSHDEESRLKYQMLHHLYYYVLEYYQHQEVASSEPLNDSSSPDLGPDEPELTPLKRSGKSFVNNALISTIKRGRHRSMSMEFSSSQRGSFDMLTGLRALKVSGVPHDLASLFMILSNVLGDIAVGIRAQRRPRFDLYVAFKSADIKTQTSGITNGGVIVEGLIPIDQATFGRDSRYPIPNQYLPCDLIYPVQVINRFILNAKLVFSRCENNKQGLILMPSNSEHATPFQVQYRVNFSNYVNFTAEIDDNIFSPRKDETTRTQPLWWIDAYGNYDDFKNRWLIVEYKTKNMQSWRPLQVLSAVKRPQNGESVPAVKRIFTRDFDVAYIGHPPHLNPESYRVFNCGRDNERQELLQVLPQTLAHYYAKYCIEIDALKQVDAMKHERRILELEEYLEWFLCHPHLSFVKTAGFVTPFELLIISFANILFGNRFPHTPQTLRHGPDNHSPYPSEMMKDHILHFYMGQIILTQNVEVLLTFFMQDGFFNKMFIHAHERWDPNFRLTFLQKQQQSAKNSPFSSLVDDDYRALVRRETENKRDKSEVGQRKGSNDIEHDATKTRRRSLSGFAMFSGLFQNTVMSDRSAVNGRPSSETSLQKK